MLQDAVSKRASTPTEVSEQMLDKHKPLVESFKSYNFDKKFAKPVNIYEGMLNKAGVKDIKDLHPFKVVRAAMMAENFVKETLRANGKLGLEETSRANMPQWVRNGLAMISTSFAEDITDQVVSVQPMASRSAKVHYLDIQTEVQKGNIAANTRIFNALSGFRGTENFSSEKIENEPIGAAGATDYGTVTPLLLSWRPAIPGTVVITDGTQVIRDDRNGNLIGDTGAGGTKTINYITGQVNFSFTVATTGPVVASYNYNIEAALQLPEYGIQLRQDTVEARDRALGAAWSQQALFDFMNDFGIDAEPTILDAGNRIIQMERFKHVVNTLRNSATGGTLVFNNAPPALSVPYSLHIKTFSYGISRLQNLIWERTQTVRPNVLVISPDLWFLVAAQDGFEGEAVTANDGIAGPRKVGTLTRHGISVFADPTYPRTSGLLTYRGPEFVSTAAIVGMYVPFYASPVHIRAFRRDVALLTSYAIHVVNPDMIGLISVTGL
jgi:hypothetical protein